MGIDRVIQDINEQEEKQKSENTKKQPINKPPRWKITYPDPPIERPIREYEISEITLKNKEIEMESVLNNPNISDDEKSRLKRKYKAEIKYIKKSLGYEVNIDIIKPLERQDKESCKKPKSESKSKSLSEKITSKVGNIFKSIKGKN